MSRVSPLMRDICTFDDSSCKASLSPSSWMAREMYSPLLDVSTTCLVRSNHTSELEACGSVGIVSSPSLKCEAATVLGRDSSYLCQETHGILLVQTSPSSRLWMPVSFAQKVECHYSPMKAELMREHRWVPAQIEAIEDSTSQIPRYSEHTYTLQIESSE